MNGLNLLGWGMKIQDDLGLDTCFVVTELEKRKVVLGGLMQRLEE